VSAPRTEATIGRCDHSRLREFRAPRVEEFTYIPRFARRQQAHLDFVLGIVDERELLVFLSHRLLIRGAAQRPASGEEQAIVGDEEDPLDMMERVLTGACARHIVSALGQGFPRDQQQLRPGRGS
jgi:hypothetical protein